MTTDLVLLHGGGQGSWVWRDTIAALEALAPGQAARTLVLDVPGCGAKRGRDTAQLNLDDVVDELLADIRARGFGDVTLVGHSQGGTVLPRLVERQPQLFHRLVYLSCCAPLPGQDIREMMGGGVHGSDPGEVGWPLDPATVSRQQQWAACFCNDMDAAATARFMASLGHDMWPMQTMTETDWRYDHLAAVPATFIVCDDDAILTPPWQLCFAERLQVQQVTHIGGGHQVMNSRPAELAEALLGELGR